MTRYQRFFLSGLTLLTIAMVPAAVSRAASSSINPVADAFVTTGPSSSPSPAPDLATSNYGGAGVLDLAPSGMPHGEAQSVMRFDLSSTKSAFDTLFGVGQWMVQSISLQLTAVPSGQNAFLLNAASAGNFNVSWMQNDSWVEGTGRPNTPTSTGITYATLPNFLSGSDQALGTFAYDGNTTATGTYNLNLTSGPSGDILGGSTLSLRLSAADNSVSYLFNSRTAASGLPVLTVTAEAVPEPSTWVAGALGAVTLFWFVRRSRTASGSSR